MSTKNKPFRIAYQFLIFISINFVFSGCGTDKSLENEYSAYLFSYFTGNELGGEAIRFAISEDGYNYRTLNNNQAVLDNAKISSTGGVRDPHILRGADGKTFYMVATDLYVPEMGWKNYAMVLLKSNDLIHWESSVVNIPESFSEKFGDVWRVWAPQTIYDKDAGKYMIYFSMKQGDDPDKIYYAYANADFTGLETAPEQLYFSPTNKGCIDGDIVFKDGKYHLFMKSEDGEPGIKLAISEQLTKGYKMPSNKRVDEETGPVEGSAIFKLNHSNEWILMYDLYTQGRYQFTKSADLKHFTIIDEQISMNFHPRHGSVMPITKNELKTLVGQWGTFDDPLIEVKSELLKTQNISVNTKNRTIHLPVKRGTDLTRFDPDFKSLYGTSFSAKGSQDFSKGGLEYSYKIDGKNKALYHVIASEDHNPIVEGFFADPDIFYSEKTNKYYLYPTSDGYHNWEGDYFKVFSSENLLDWTDEGVILDLKKDVAWANNNAWAPCIIEKKINGEYKYFFYYTAEKKIGVAVADNPTGPFVDSGKALIDYKPQGINIGIEIDPDVFTDTKSGKSYLYWGNGYMVGAELNKDMLSIKTETMTLMTPDNTYREGTYVIYRQGTYYYMWSEDDTRSPNYKVRYATSQSPLGKLTIPANNIVIQKDVEQEIFGTGHNSAIQIPGKDEWYLVYHRFTYPKGKEMGRSAGYHREVCIDKLEFNNDGSIIEVKPTLKGIDL